MFGKRLFSIAGPLGGALAFAKMEGQESLGRPFHYEVEMLAVDHALDLSGVVGRSLTVQAELPGGASHRYFNGLVTRLTMAGTDGRHARYRATLRPWLWLLTRTSNCRIFQGLTVPEIAKQVFRENGFTDYREALAGEYRPWEYLVQYRESDFDFVCRLLEQEGIYFYFTHQADKHTLVLADSYAAHQAEGVNAVPYFPPSTEALREDHVDAWSASLTIQSGTYVATDYDFERPTASLFAKLAVSARHAQGTREIYDYPGLYATGDEGQRQVRVRLEERQAELERCEGAGRVRTIGSGGLLKLTDYPREDQNKEYLVVDARYELTGNRVETEDGGDSTSYRCHFTAIDSQRPYRTPRTTPRPRVEGPQTATVVGKSGEEIWTDKYGRVKVRFHWDREGNPGAPPDPHGAADPPRPEEESSCWVRVSQVWAGAGWGAMHIPRVGQEVIVDFLEGDPARPIITGRVYNGRNLPPYDLPANQTQSGIKSRSSAGGEAANFNEIRFEDKKGAEELHLQAEKDLSTLVKHDQTTTVQNDQTTTVQANRTVTVSGNETHSVTGTRSLSVTGNETETFQAQRTVAVTGSDTHTISGARTESYAAGRTRSVTGSDATNVTGPKNTNVVGPCEISATLQLHAHQGGNQLLLKDLVLLESQGQMQVMNQQCHVNMSGGVLTVSAAQSLVLVCGASSIALMSDGTVEIKGTKVTAAAGSGGLELAAPGATVSGTKTVLAARAVNEISGALIKIN